MQMGLRPVVYEADRIGGRLRTVGFDGCDPELTAEMGAMRFPPSSTAFQHYVDLVGLRDRAVPQPARARHPVDRRRPQGPVALRHIASTTCPRSTTR